MSDSESLGYDSEDKDKESEVDEVMTDDDDDDIDGEAPILQAAQGVLQEGEVAGDISNIQGSADNLIVNEPELELSDDSDYEEDSFQKFDNETKRDYIEALHPEVLQLNYDEILDLCRVVRDEDGTIIDELHKTSPWLTKYEYTRIIGQRTKQLNEGVEPFVKVPNNIVENSIIAKMELSEKKIPFIIRRPMPGGGSEFWKLKDLELISH